MKSTSIAFLVLLARAACWGADSTASLFQQGVEAYRAGDYVRASTDFHKAAARRPASGTLQNFGNAQWQQGETGRAILAWEQALWLDPFNRSVRGNLRFARRTAQLDAPDLAWYEVVSSWLPVNWWAWIAGLSFWLAIAMTMLPSIFRWRKAAWQQAGAALGLAIFLLSVPAHLGVDCRSRIGFVLQKETSLRLTPTDEAQVITRLPSGEPGRFERMRGRFVLIRTGRSLGWVQQDEFGLTCPNN